MVSIQLPSDAIVSEFCCVNYFHCEQVALHKPNRYLFPKAINQRGDRMKKVKRWDEDAE
ncbi:unnamed protein product [Tenebrio molitor]|jgi:hypothetical protein|nr:unnamed protein product [Tenebrio molitor]